MYAFLYRHCEYYRVQSLKITCDPNWKPTEKENHIEYSGSLADPVSVLQLGHRAEPDNYRKLLEFLKNPKNSKITKVE